MKQLTFEKFFPFLPYELKIQWVDSKDVWGISFGETDYTNNLYSLETLVFTINEGKDLGWKPILRPLPDLTKPITHKGETFVPLQWLSVRYNMDFVDRYKKHWHEGLAVASDLSDVYWSVVQLLISWHFDVFGLIPEGLAIDINTLKK